MYDVYGQLIMSGFDPFKTYIVGSGISGSPDTPTGLSSMTTAEITTSNPCRSRVTCSQGQKARHTIRMSGYVGVVT